MRRRGEGCDFCGGASAQHRGERASICVLCVARLSSIHAPPEARAVVDAVPNLEMTSFQPASAVLQILGPIEPEILENAARELAGRLSTEPGLRIEGVPARDLGLSWLDSPAGPMLVVAPGLPDGRIPPHLHTWVTWWSRIPGDEAPLADALAALVREDYVGCTHALHRVAAAEPRRQLLEALRRVGLGQWTEAIDLLERLERRVTEDGKLRDAIRYDLGRLLVLTGRARAAERVLDGLTVEDAPELLDALDAELMRRADCRLGLQRLASALEEYRQHTGELPRRLEDLRPRHLTALPSGCEYHYRRKRGHFELGCRTGHPGLPKGWPRWAHRLGPLSRPEERPPSIPQSAKPASGPAEALAPTGTRRGLWLSVARQSAGDLRGALLALGGQADGDARFHGLLLSLRLGRCPELPVLRTMLRAEGFRLRGSAVLDERLEATAAVLDSWEPEQSFVWRAGLFLGLVLGGQPGLCRRIRPEPVWGWQQARLAWLCDAAVWWSGSPFPRARKELLRRGLERAWDHVTPEATLLLEMAMLLGDGEEPWILMLLARLYRQAQQWDAAASALDDAARAGYPPALVALEGCLQALDRRGRRQDLLALVELAELHPQEEDLRLELQCRMLDVGAPLDPKPLLGCRNPQARMVGAWIAERQGDADEAMARYRLLSQQYPDWPTPRLFEALALEALGRVEEALARCREGLQRRPDHVLLHVLAIRLAPQDSQAEASRERVRALRPDLADWDWLDLRTIDWPTPSEGVEEPPTG